MRLNTAETKQRRERYHTGEWGALYRFTSFTKTHTFTNSMTRYSSVGTSISSIRRTILGCFTLLKIDTSFWIMCSCSRENHLHQDTQHNNEGLTQIKKAILFMSFPGGSDGKKSVCNVGYLGLIPGSGRSPVEGHGNPLQYSCLENPMDQGAWVGYSPWGRKELDTTEWLTLNLYYLKIKGDIFW